MNLLVALGVLFVAGLVGVVGIAMIPYRHGR